MVKLAIITAMLCLSSVAIAQEGSGRAEFESGRALFLQGEYQEALPLLQKAYERSGKRASTTLALGKCRQALGDKEGAVLLYREYLRAVPTPADTDKVKAQADQLERELHSETTNVETEPDFLFQGRQDAPPEAPLWGETEAPPPEEPSLFERPVFWIGVGVVVIAAGVVIFAIAPKDDGDPFGGSLGAVLHR